MLEMLLHVCLWILVSATDRTSSLSLSRCGGQVSVDRAPVGTVVLSVPRPSGGGSVWSCRWVIQVPEGRSLWLKLTPAAAGASVVCGPEGEARPQVLDGQEGALFTYCGGDKALITWTGSGLSPDEIQLSYHVQEDERTSWLESNPTSPPTDHDLVHWTQKGSSYTGSGYLPGPGRGSRGSVSNRERLRPTSTPQGLWGPRTGTPPFPEEEPNNGAETSGTVWPRSGTHPGSEHTHVFSTEIASEPKFVLTQSTNTGPGRSVRPTHRSGPKEDITPSTSWGPYLETRDGATIPPGQSRSWRIYRRTKGPGSDPSRSPFTVGSPESDTQATPFSSPAGPGAPQWTGPDQTTRTADCGAGSQSECHSRSTATYRTEPLPTSNSPKTQNQVTGTDQSTDWKTPTSGDGLLFRAVERTGPESQTLEPTNTVQTRTSGPDPGPWYRQTTWPDRSTSSEPQSTQNQSSESESSQTQPTQTQSSESESPQTQSTQSESPQTQPTQTQSSKSESSQAQSTKSQFVQSQSAQTESQFTLFLSNQSLPTQTPQTPVPVLWTSVPVLSRTAALSSQPPLRTTETKSRPLSSAEALTWAPTQRSRTSQTARFYVVPDQPAVLKVESVQLLLQIMLEEPVVDGTAAWAEDFLQETPGFSRVLGVWSSGQAVQLLVEFRTSGVLQWLGETGTRSALDPRALAEAVGPRREFGSSRVINVTLGGLQGSVCDWLLQCPAGYRCLAQTGGANYTCSSLCHFDYCHHHGLCTHHPGGGPVCRCLVGEDFWFVGLRCDTRMTRARLLGACLCILVVIVTMVGVLALVAVRRYRALLIQAKVDQTRSSYRRFNHFDELSGRFWLRSSAGSADSVDNPVFTRSDELLQLRALDRPCCYHDDTLSLSSTCPSHEARISTIYPHSSQYGWRGSEGSVGEGALDSGKVSDFSVCSWPVEPIHWTPFPILQQLASNKPPPVRVSRPRSYCEGMELVEMEKSWTA